MWYLIFQAEIYLLCLDLSYNTSILFMLYEHALLLNMSYYLLILDLCESYQFCLIAFSEKINLFSSFFFSPRYKSLSHMTPYS